MPEFTVFKDGLYQAKINSTGNLSALCDYLELDGIPTFPVSTFQGMLYAEVGHGTLYVVIDEALTPLQSVKQKVPINLSKRLLNRTRLVMSRHFNVDIMEPAHVV